MPHPEETGKIQHKPAATRRTWIQVLFALTVAAALAAGFFTVQRQKTSAKKDLQMRTAENVSALPLVDVITVQNSPAEFPLKLPGDTAAWYESTIYARVDGYISKWFADIGDHVRKGQVLAVIDTPDLDAQLAAAQAKIAASAARITAKEAEVGFAKTTYERWRDSPKGVVSEQERESKKANYDSAAAQLIEAKAQHGLDRANLDRFKALAQFKQVTAPFDGVITERRIDIGNLITAGSSANTTPLYKMEQNNPIRVFADVPQNAAGDMKAGVAAQIRVSSLPNRVFEGKISRTAEVIDPQSRTLRVEVDIPNTDMALAPGMYVSVTFQIPSTGLMQAPAAAMLFRADGPYVAVIDGDRQVAFRKVTIVRDNGAVVELGSGVAAGERIALNLSNQITEGEKVTINDIGGADTNAAASAPKP